MRVIRNQRNHPELLGRCQRRAPQFPQKILPNSVERHTPLPALGRKKQVNLCKIKASLVYMVSSQTAQASSISRDRLTCVCVFSTLTDGKKKKKESKCGIYFVKLQKMSIQRQRKMQCLSCHDIWTVHRNNPLSFMTEQTELGGPTEQLFLTKEWQ